MDPVSLTVSTFTLGGVALKAASGAKRLHTDYRCAEQDARHVKSQYEQLCSNIEQCSGLAGNNSGRQGKEALRELAASWPKHHAIGTKKEKLRFALTQRSKQMEAVQRLKDLESSQILTAGLESTQILTEIEKKTLETMTMTADIKTLFEAQNARIADIEEQMTGLSAAVLDHTHILHFLVHKIDSAKKPNRRSVSQVYLFEWLARYLGLFARLTISSDESNNKYSLVFRLPIFYAFAVMGFLSLSGGWPVFHTVLMRPRRVVKSDAAIVKACANGDLVLIRKLFAAKLAHPDDVSEDTSTLLRHAIRAGSEDVVQFLLEQGAQSNLTFGDLDISPLDNAFYIGNVAMIRLLLQSGADIDYINGRAWTALSYLWDPVRPNHSTTLEILRICHRADFSGWNRGDKMGWAPAHRAAAFGEKDHIDMFQRFNNHVDPVNQQTWEAGWNYIQCAARFGNVCTFQALADSVHYIELERMLDNRDWTLLHLAAAGGSLELMRLLAGAGLSPDRWSFPSDELMPPELVNKALTPRMVAAHYGYIKAYDTAFGDIVGVAQSPRAGDSSYSPVSGMVMNTSGSSDKEELSERMS